MAWKIKFGETSQKSEIYFEDKLIGYVAKFNVRMNADSGIPEIDLTIKDPRLEIEGTICRACKEEEGIASKKW